ncbi:NUC173-domain-containing protein [Basidiobolus meristosporus CBS 931.73]|uniref:NUC173-domain-containing protein n=1 Tax=Basidiobolus meristosporus CBS 931.73 TaxID=1314790 RepID=A0A1Y1VRK9_9FUNG|nr:NUC173-domain-containing protein [Basidiobolus meristosporus CBS 931.73]ORX97463.1 NUC173-domain-containing protein [Basidiobolus meristosporus CBS 931.73]|eukprot:ORX63932.1 NUC173-domain-containing protein [Basidiobolus meristosporus CBS 931.73]
MENTFSKLRTQVNSTVGSQKSAAMTLLAVEETLREQNVEPSPTAYFATLFTLLQEQQETDGENEIKSAVIYLLSIVFPHLSQNVLRSKYAQLLATLVNTLETSHSSAPTLRSTLTCLEILLAAQDSATWSGSAAKKTFQAIMLICLDGRPKVRRKAQESIHEILAHPPPPTLQHPASFPAADFCLKVLKESTKSDPSSALHILALIKPIVFAWPAAQLNPLCEILLQLPKFNNSYLTVAVFEVFENLFQHSSEDFGEERTEDLLRTLMEMKPNINDVHLSTSWLKIMNSGYKAYAQCNAEKCARQIGLIFALIFPDLECDQKQIINAATECLSGFIQNCVTEKLIESAGESNKSPLKKIASLLESGLSIRYRAAWPGILSIYSALFKKLGRASTPLLNRAIELIADMRSADGMELKQEIDETLGAIIAAIGPQTFLNLLPLNLENPSSDAKQIGRAWLLPILKDNIINTELQYFVKELVPLSERLQGVVLKFNNKGRAIEAKIYEALVQQIWGMLPGFCHLPTDLPTAFDRDFAELLGNNIYSEPGLRPVICTSLQLLIQKNLEFSQSEIEDEKLKKQYLLEKKDAAANVQHLAQFTTNFLAIFFNIFSQTLPEYRGYLLETIRLFLKITGESDVNATFKKVHHLLADALKNHTPTASQDPTSAPPMAHTMLDLAIAMIVYLDPESLAGLFQTVIALIGQEEDGILQKKAYKVINTMCECESGKENLRRNIEELQTKVLDATLTTTPSAKKERLKALANVVSILPSNDLHLIPSILSEAIVCTKEVNERSRNLAYDLLVVMGSRMEEGGVVANNAQATISEYFTMVTAGLAGSTPHMISATITSLSRLLFEFKSKVSQTIVDDLLKTIRMFVISTNREIVKSALGFVKVSVLTLEPDFLRPHLSDIVIGILTWSHEHKNHFKAKVRHIFERLIRKFGYEDIAQFVPEEHKKLVINIKKRKERAKRKKSQAAGSDVDEEMEDATQKKASFSSAYENVLYGSDSEIDDSDEDQMDVDREVKPKKKGQAQAWIKEDHEGPLDFLDRRAVSQVTSTKPSKRTQQLKSVGANFKATDDGRLMIDESSDDSEEEPVELTAEQKALREAESNYLEAMTSKEGYTRVGNRIKFSNKRRGNEDDFPEEDDDTPARPQAQGKKRRGKDGQIVGKEYKAKKAGGDVKKGRLDPYAYVPLNPTALKSRGKLSLKGSKAGKRRN